jgi:SAM-dependent methyltransferase
VGINAELTVADIKTAAPQQADFVVSFGLIEHFDDPAKVLGHHRRYTAPSGYTAVTVPNYAHPALKWMLAKFSPETLATHNLEIMSAEAMRKSFIAAGFVDVRTGCAGPASIPSSRVRQDALGRAFGTGARAWKLATEILPSRWPWSTHVWGIGRAPA